MNTTTKGNKIKKVQVQQQKKFQTKIKREAPETQVVKLKIFNFKSECCPGIKPIFFYAA